ncbi:hypothetical protein [Streptomyces sp. AcE210]|uniref:hypothetical protein n=1 Tax=Streptomyces sp. AcE210 TaxID=2292703 RepID=UPI001058FA51|nr:hypothetical protein [Streptomyces sp. AcE210]
MPHAALRGDPRGSAGSAGVQHAAAARPVPLALTCRRQEATGSFCLPCTPEFDRVTGQVVACGVGDHEGSGRGFFQGVGDVEVVQAQVLVGAVGIDVGEALVGASGGDLVVVVVGVALVGGTGRGRLRRRGGRAHGPGVVHGGHGVAERRAGPGPVSVNEVEDGEPTWLPPW